MASVVLSLTLTVIVTGVLWLSVGSRMPLSTDARQNDVLNFVAYGLMILPLAVAFVFFGVS